MIRDTFNPQPDILKIKDPFENLNGYFETLRGVFQGVESQIDQGFDAGEDIVKEVEGSLTRSLRIRLDNEHLLVRIEAEDEQEFIDGDWHNSPYIVVYEVGGAGEEKNLGLINPFSDTGLDDFINSLSK